MKNLLILLSLISINLHSQESISFSLLQDVKLGLGMDSEHGNTGFTPDVIINMNWEGKQFEYYYFSIQSFYEHAELSSGYFKRYGVNGIWNLNRLIVDKLEIGIGVGLGMINRPNAAGLGSYSGAIDISYPIYKNLSVIVKNEYVRRPLLDAFRYNLSAGLKYTFKK